ncbi:MAG TPA: hypothetical protein VMU75_13640 [Acidimicrobiales bacterium]|nr:hypothetical protein [Acidimicrobiales bacterium]
MTSWTGWDVRGSASAQPDAAEKFAQSALHDSDAGVRYELIAVAARGFRPPRFLSVVDLSEQGQTDRPNEAEREGLKQTWSLLYRRVAETEPAVVPPYAIYLLGVNPPAGTTDEELKVFNDFYTNVHLPEVAERRHALRAARYELVDEVRPPHQGAPRFLAVYEVDEEAASIRRHVGPPYVTGPEVWQRHTTPWRLWYRRLLAPHGGAHRSDRTT